MENKWQTHSLEQLFSQLESSPRGLAALEASRRLEESGPNTLPEPEARSLSWIFLSQFNSSLIFILLVAALIVFAIGDTTDALIILAVLIFNAIVGTIQEGRAENTLKVLKQFVETKATVLRDDKELIILDRELVPGDVIIIQEGEKVPADARLISSFNLKVDEASLTGESEPVHKEVDETVRNIVFKGTNIVSGNGVAMVVTTGLNTTIGKIAKEISAIDSEIPLKANIRHLSHLIIVTVSFVSLLLFVVGLLYGQSIKEMFTTVVSLSVSVIPEGLPIVMTLVLASGVWRMSKRNVLVKKLQAVEALGQASIIAVDKTGTITKNELVVRQVWLGGQLFELGGVGYEPSGEIKLGGAVVGADDHPDLLFAGQAAALGSTARVSFSEESKSWRIAGDPTEAAMIIFGQKVGFHKNDLLDESPLLAEIPFDYHLKYHAAVHQVARRKLLTVIGAPEIVLALCNKINRTGRSQVLSAKAKAELEAVLYQMTEQGQRVVAMAVNPNFSADLEPSKIHQLTFVGFLGMQDVLRPEVEEAMSRAKSAGVRVVMITGDHQITARAIAREAGIYRDGDTVLSGAEIDELTDFELANKLDKVSVFARVTPEHKLRIINLFKKRGEIVAMTGDGVNDAPSLVAADLGVAMGKIGTEVAKEASDLVLLDDDFGSIVSAIEEGRSIYKTIKKIILYLFSTSLGEVLTITVALFIGLPLPILAAQIIWLNFVTDGFLDVSLAMEPKESGLLSSRFVRPNKYIVDGLMLKRMILMALPMMVGTLFLFQKYADIDLAKAWTISLTTLAMFQWFNAWNCRSDNKSIFNSNPFSNRFLVGATIIVVGLHFVAVYTPFLQGVLKTVPLTFSEWIMIIPVAASVVLIEELRKWRSRRVKISQ